MSRFQVITRNGDILRPGDIITTEHHKRGIEHYTMISCTHPRKVYVDVNAQDGYSQTYFANVLDVGIWDTVENEWTFEPSWPHRINSPLPLNTEKSTMPDIPPDVDESDIGWLESSTRDKTNI